MANQMNRNKRPTSDPSDWQSCPEGELQELSRHLKTEHWRKQINKAAHLGAWSLLLMAVGVFLGSLTMSDHSPILLGGITCEECLAEVESYHSHLSGQQAMPVSQAEQMQAHLAACDLCRPKFETMYPGVLELNASNGIWQMVLPTVGLLATAY